MQAAAAEAGRDATDILLSSSGQIIAAETEAEFDEMMEQRAAASEVSRDELEAYFEARRTPRGTYEQVREELQRMKELGVQRFYLQSIFAGGDLDSLMEGLEIG